MRIVAGKYRSRRLKVGPPEGTRPTSDRLRETLFNILGSAVIESKFLDAYAGVGAIGIEALSRGASRVEFVDSSSKACAAIETNLETFDIVDGCRVFQSTLADVMERGFEVRFDIVFLDPPYDRHHLYRQDLERFGQGTFLEAGGLLVVEHARTMELPESIGVLGRIRTHPQGDSALTFFEAEAK